MIELAADRERKVYLVGRRHSPHVQDLRDFLGRNQIKRVASAVGEGAMAVQQVHRFLAEKKGRA